MALNSNQSKVLWKKLKDQGTSKNISVFVYLEKRDVILFKTFKTDWLKVAKNQNSKSDPFLGAIIYPLVINSTTTNVSDYRKQLENQVSFGIPKGCSVNVESLIFQNNSNATTIINSCNEINTRVYLLRYKFKFSSDEDADTVDPLEYQLQQIIEIRKNILNKNPLASVYFYPQIDHSFWEGNLDCDIEQLRASIFLGYILNWGNATNFQIILTTPSKYDTVSEYDSLRLLMRQMNHPYSNFYRSSFQRYVSGHNISWVWKAYLERGNSSYSYPCLQYDDDPIVGDDFFLSEYLGTIFYPVYHSHNRDNAANAIETYTLMFQYIFHRLRLVELKLSSGFLNVLAAVEKAVEIKPTYNPSVFISYVISKTQKDAREFQTLLDYIKHSVTLNPPLVQVVHIDLSEFVEISEESEEARFYPFFEEDYKTMSGDGTDNILKMVQLTHRLDIPIGIQLDFSGGCEKGLACFLAPLFI